MNPPIINCQTTFGVSQLSIVNLKRFFLLFLFLPAVYLASGQMPGMPYGVLSLDCSGAPAQPEATSGKTAVIAGSSQTYSVTPVDGVTYEWSCTGSISGDVSTTANSITVIVDVGGGSITVIPINSCGRGPATAWTVTATTCPGVIVEGSVHAGIEGLWNIPDNKAYGELVPSYFTREDNSSLCIYRDTGWNSITSGTATAYCGGSPGWAENTGVPTGWRLPNVGEAAYVVGALARPGAPAYPPITGVTSGAFWTSSMQWSATSGDWNIVLSLPNQTSYGLRAGSTTFNGPLTVFCVHEQD